MTIVAIHESYPQQRAIGTSEKITDALIAMMLSTKQFTTEPEHVIDLQAAASIVAATAAMGVLNQVGYKEWHFTIVYNSNK